MDQKVEDIIENIKALSPDDYNSLIRALPLLRKDEPTERIADFANSLKTASKQRCPYCGGIHIVRNGHRKDGVQKFCCRDCNRSFVPTTNTMFAYSHKDFSTWISYIKGMMSGGKLMEMSVSCGINLKTSFFWRHKILNSLCQMEDTVELEGISECDETFFALSYKGNRKAFSEGGIERDAHKRGGEVHTRGLSKEQVCVPCAVDRKHKSVSKIACLGACSHGSLNHVLGNKFAKGTCICTDGNSAYQRFAKENNLELVQLTGGKMTKGIFHIQHLNSYHSLLKKFIRGFNGVSTKYLNGYLAWHNYINYAKEVVQEKVNILKEWLVNCGNNVSRQSIFNMPPIPC